MVWQLVPLHPLLFLILLPVPIGHGAPGLPRRAISMQVLAELLRESRGFQVVLVCLEKRLQGAVLEATECQGVARRVG